jgi:hypothetical protein
MYLCAVLFLIIGVGSLVVAVVPGADEWVAEKTLDSFSPTTSGSNDEVAEIVTQDDIGGVHTTAWILAVTFLPMAGLFVFCGRWFKSMEPSFNAMMQTSAQMARNSSAMYQQYAGQPVVAGSGVITNVGGGVITSPSPVPSGQPPVPKFNDPINQPPLV